MNHWIIYMYTFPNDKRYIGKTNRTLKERQGCKWIGYKKCIVLWKAIQKYGIDNIIQTILVERDMTDKEASELEKLYIAIFRTNCSRYKSPAYGYNLTDGGEGVNGWHPRGEDLERRRNQLAEFAKARIGTHISEESKEKMRQSHLGIKYGPMSDELKKKIGKANSLENISIETRARKSLACGQWVKAIPNTTQEELIFPSITETAKYFNVTVSIASRWLSGDRKPSNNYKFEKYIPTETERERRFQELVEQLSTAS